MSNRFTRTMIVASAIFLTGCTVNATERESIPRYQMSVSGSTIVLLNTDNGRMWINGGENWVETGPMKATTRP